jgi:PKD repeat protein
MVIGTGGNRPNISPTAFLVSDCGYIYLSGWGGSTNATTIPGGNNTVITRNYVGGTTTGLPITNDAYQPTTSGDDFYLAVLSYDFKRLLYSTFLGGTQSATHVDGGTSRFDKRGTVYHAVCAGCGGFSDFPAVNVPAAHRTNNSANCNNAVFKFDLSLLEAKMRTNSIHFDNPGVTKVCIPDTIVFENFSFGGEQYYWDLGDGTTYVKTDRSPIYHQYKEKDKVYTVWLKAIDKGTCKVRDSVSIQVAVYQAEADVQPDDELCEGTSYTLQASGGEQYLWQSSDGSFSSTAPTPKVSPVDTTVYHIVVTEINGCTYEDSVRLNVIPLIIVEFELKREGDCMDLPSIRVENKTDSLWQTDVMLFDFGDGTTSDAETIEHEYEREGVYTIKLMGARQGGDALCVTEQTVSIPISSLFIPNVITPSDEDELNDVFFIQYGDTAGASPADSDLKTSVVIYNRWGNKVFEDPDYQYNWRGDNVNAGIYYFEVTVEGRATCKGWLHVMK